MNTAALQNCIKSLEGALKARARILRRAKEGDYLVEEYDVDNATMKTFQMAADVSAITLLPHDGRKAHELS